MPIQFSVFINSILSGSNDSNDSYIYNYIIFSQFKCHGCLIFPAKIYYIGLKSQYWIITGHYSQIQGEKKWKGHMEMV